MWRLMWVGACVGASIGVPALSIDPSTLVWHPGRMPARSRPGPYRTPGRDAGARWVTAARSCGSVKSVKQSAA